MNTHTKKQIHIYSQTHTQTHTQSRPGPKMPRAAARAQDDGSQSE